MKIHSVIIDSNFLIRDYKLSSYFIKKLIKTKKFYCVQVCIPEIVYDECIGNYEHTVIDNKAALNQAADKFNAIGLEGDLINKKNINKKLDSYIKKYQTNLKNFIKLNDISLLKYPKTSHQDIVKRIYKRAKPFTDNSTREKGYKDFLIVESIRVYQEELKVGEGIILLTDNLKDFVEKDLIINKQKTNSPQELFPLDEAFGLKSVYVAQSPAILFGNLGRNLNNSPPFDSTQLIDALANLIKQRLLEDDAEFFFEVFSSFSLNVKISEQKFKFEIIESNANVDPETEILEISGIINLSFECSFVIDNYDIALKLIDREFVLFKEIEDRIDTRRHSTKDDWTEEFNNIKFSREFLFDYIDFDHDLNKSTSEVDPTFLSISRI